MNNKLLSSKLLHIKNSVEKPIKEQISSTTIYNLVVYMVYNTRIVKRNSTVIHDSLKRLM